MLRVTPGNRLRLAVMAGKRDNYTARSLLKLAGFACVVVLFLFFFQVTASLALVRSGATKTAPLMQ